jgi:DNA-binding response OmpR family regulator
MDATGSTHEGDTHDKLLILIVEDDRDVQEGYEICLSGEYRLLQAYSITHARELFHAHKDKIRAVLMDYNLPEGNTAELTREIRGIVGETLPIIGTSGDYDGKAKQSATGCNYYCQKGSEHALRDLESFLPH